MRVSSCYMKTLIMRNISITSACSLISLDNLGGLFTIVRDTKNSSIVLGLGNWGERKIFQDTYLCASVKLLF